MEYSAGVQSLAPIGQAAPAAPAARLQRLRAWLFELPNDLGIAISIVAIFSVICLVIAAVYAAPLNMPRERISAALGASAVVPVVIAIALYVVLRFTKALLGHKDAAAPPLLQAITVDLSLMVLFLVATYFHFSLKTWAHVINPALYDEAYYAIDLQFQPILDAFDWIRASFFTLIPGADALYQGAFLLLFIGGFCSLAVTRDPIYPRFCIAVLLTMSLGALSYLIAPALGPFLYEEGLNPQATQAQASMLWAHEQVKLGGMAWIEEAGPAYFTGALAAMPSLHIAHAAVMTFFVCQARSPLIAPFLLICAWVAVESVASRWHYLIDLPVGLALAAFVIWLTIKLSPRRG